MMSIPVDRENCWQKENDFETLVRANEIVKDENRLKGAKEFAEEHKKNLNDVLSQDYFKKIGFKK